MACADVAPKPGAHNPRRPASLAAVVVLLATAGAGDATRAHAQALPEWVSMVSGNRAPADDLAAAVRAVRALPSATPAIAANATPEGHWQFVNRGGDTYTAGTAAELKRAAGVLLPGLEDGFARATLIVTQESLFAGSEVMRDMPAAGSLRVVAGGETFDLRRAGGGLAVSVRPGVGLMVQDQGLFAEGLAQLRRPLDPARVRVLSATSGAPSTLAAAPTFDPVQGGAAVDPVDPDRIADALRSIPRQTAIITARVEAGNLTLAPSIGPERLVSQTRLTAAASASDVDLVVLHADPPRQPGGRNWLWQRVAVNGLDHARKRETFADFLDALAQGRGLFLVSLDSEGDGRVTLVAQPPSAPSAFREGVTGWLKEAAGTVSGHVTGSLTPAAVHASLVGEAHRRELARRLVPGLPSWIQFIYLGSAIAGLMALPTSRVWWRRIWPVEARAEYASLAGFVLARAVRGLAFATLFVPLAAVPAVAIRVLGGLAMLFGLRARPAADMPG